MVRKEQMTEGVRVIHNDPENVVPNPFKGTVLGTVESGREGHYYILVKLDPEFLECQPYKDNLYEGCCLFCCYYELDLLTDNIEEMSIEGLIRNIGEHVKKNNGQWDLTDDYGNPLFRDEKTGLLLHLLKLNEEGEPVVPISLTWFPKELLKEILKSM